MRNPLEGRRLSFPLILATSAGLIAGCSAYFSVLGLGLLFASSIPVMLMAATLELGKLVAASFLYRYWNAIQTSLKFYLTLALLVLIGITSLGNYGYLARAYEKTNDEIVVVETQVGLLETELADLQVRLEAARVSTTETKGDSREDVVRLQQRIAEERESLVQNLARLEAARVAANARRTADAAGATERASGQSTAFSKAVAADEAAIAGLIKRVEVLDRAVDAYTQQGTTGVLFRTDGVKLGQNLRAEQAQERATIAADLERFRARLERARDEQSKLDAAASAEVRGIDERLREELARLDADATAAREASAASVAALESRLRELEARLEARSASGEKGLDDLISQVRDRTERIAELKARVQNSDIGTYRFIARAFNTTADVVVKWLIVAIVLVFDPLAVTLVIGFNVALLRDAGKDTTFGAAAAPAGSAPAASRGWLAPLLAVLVTLAVAAAAWVFWPAGRTLARLDGREHLRLVPGDSFAVVSFRPSRPAAAPAASSEETPATAVADPVLKAWLGRIGGDIAMSALQDLAAGPLDPAADVLAFAKHPTRPASEDGDKPVLVCGIVFRITDRAAAEASLARLSDQMRASLRAGSGAPDSLSRNRAMIRHAGGRFLDPEGGFFSFGVTDHAAILLVELGGEPLSPVVAAEMRRCLALAAGQDQSQDSLPGSAFGTDEGVSLWADAERFFRRLPMSDATRARYRELRASVDYELRLSLRLTGPDQVGIAARYDYRQGRQSRLGLEAGDSILGEVAEDDSARLLRHGVESLELDILAERFRSVLGGEGNQVGIRQVLVEKTETSNRAAQFQLTARLENQSDQPLASVLLTLLR